MLRWLFGRRREEAAPVSPPVPVVVDLEDLEVTDADTVKLAGQSIRLVGFDAPETTRAKTAHEHAMGVAAKARLEELLANGSEVTIERVQDGDIHGRALARLFIGGRDVAEIAVEEGWGVAYDGDRRARDEMPDWESMRYPR